MYDIGGEAGSQFDDLLDALADSHRRYIISFLEEADGSVTVGDLTRNISADSGNLSNEESPGADQVYTALYHRHLPKLNDVGVIEFDPDRKTVAKSDSFSDIETLLAKFQSVDCSSDGQ